MHNARNRRAVNPPKRPPVQTVGGPGAMGGQVPSFLLKGIEPAPPVLRGFPADVLVPPRRGASLRSVELPAAAVAAAPPKPKRKPRPKRPPKPKPAKRHKAAKPPSPPVAQAIPLPRLPEPLTVHAAAPPAAPLAPLPRLPHAPPPRGPVRPLPRRRTLAPWRPAGLAAQIGQWLLGRSRKLAALLAARVADPAPAAELARLRAENERLRLQIEALLALKSEELAPSG